MNKSVSFKEGTVHYTIVGKGKPLVFLHGFLGDSSMWKAVENEIGEHYQMVFVDLPGHGRSTEISNEQTMAAMANLVHLICLQEKIESPIVFGHSMGGYVALELAKIYPIKIALVHSNFWADSVEKKTDRTRVINILKSNLPLFVKTAIPNLFFKDNKVKCQNEISELVATAMELVPNSVAAVTVGMKDRLNNAEVLEGNKVYIIQGINDPVFTHSMMASEIDKLNNKPHYLEIDACGHMGFAEQPALFVNAIKVVIDKFY